MKRYALFVSIFLLGLIFGIILAIFVSGQNILTKNQQTPAFKDERAEISLSADISSDYTLAKAQTVFFGENKEEFLVVGFNPVNYSLEKNDNLKSFLKIYKKTPQGYSPVYKFSPLFPEEIEQSHILFEDMWEIKTVPTGKAAIVTTWSQTGADYFGKYPIVIAYQNNAFAATSFYTENIADNPRLKNISWTSSDVTVKNRYDDTNHVLTILTQKVAVENDEIVLSFFGDNECHACEHKYITFRFTLEF